MLVVGSDHPAAKRTFVPLLALRDEHLWSDPHALAPQTVLGRAPRARGGILPKKVTPVPPASGVAGGDGSGKPGRRAPPALGRDATHANRRAPRAPARPARSRSRVAGGDAQRRIGAGLGRFSGRALESPSGEWFIATRRTTALRQTTRGATRRSSASHPRLGEPCSVFGSRLGLEPGVSTECSRRAHELPRSAIHPVIADGKKAAWDSPL